MEAETSTASAERLQRAIESTQERILERPAVTFNVHYTRRHRGNARKHNRASGDSEPKEVDSPVQDTMPQSVITEEKNPMISGGASALNDDPGRGAAGAESLEADDGEPPNQRDFVPAKILNILIGEDTTEGVAGPFGLGRVDRGPNLLGFEQAGIEFKSDSDNSLN
ncbi:hypothetical protein G5I_07865 [Acromyrmex echinatior]|uniref:Uncharacterized protein n=1 Tax=Acromyrmex echinatior TaxID=103372 RepID=F4WPY6_ACREC|nr:hypothetical protein G5I_07865 [Acromyrmex echinatior]